jgi:hypothetical protein
MLALMQHTVIKLDNLTSCKCRKKRLAVLPQAPQLEDKVRRLLHVPKQQVGDAAEHKK